MLCGITCPSGGSLSGIAKLISGFGKSAVGFDEDKLSLCKQEKVFCRDAAEVVLKQKLIECD